MNNRVREKFLEAEQSVRPNLDSSRDLTALGLSDVVGDQAQRLGALPFPVLRPDDPHTRLVLGDEEDRIVVLGRQEHGIAEADRRRRLRAVGPRARDEHGLARLAAADPVEAVDLAVGVVVGQQQVALPDGREAGEPGVGRVGQLVRGREEPRLEPIAVLVHAEKRPRVRAHDVDVPVLVVLHVLEPAPRPLRDQLRDVALPDDLPLVEVVFQDDVGAGDILSGGVEGGSGVEEDGQVTLRVGQGWAKMKGWVARKPGE